MKIEVAVGMVFFCAMILFLFCASGEVSASTLYVPDNYSTIQAAVDVAYTGDVVIVREGTYTENIDVNKSLTIRSENGYVYTIVQATKSSDHVFEISADYVNIIGFTVMGPTWRDKAGIYLDANYCNISYNNISNNAHGILLGNSSNNTLMNNIASNNGFSIILVNSSDTMLMNNIASNNSEGIFLAYSSNNTLTNNTMSGNAYNFGVYGEHLSHYIQNIDTSNKVDGKPIYYWVNQKNKQIPNDAGYVGIVNSTDIGVRDLTLMDNSNGVLLVYSSNSKIENVKVLNSSYAIYLIKSNNNTITNNIASNNYYGIYLVGSSNNTLMNNNASNNWIGNGIHLGASNNNVLMDNIASNNDGEGISLWNSSNNMILNTTCEKSGISLCSSSNNAISNCICKNCGIILYGESLNNTISNCACNGITITSSSNNTILCNTFRGSNVGINLGSSSNNMVLNNMCEDCDRHGIQLLYSSNNTIANNTCKNCLNGILSFDSSNNTLMDNNVSNNDYGIFLDGSSNNILTDNRVWNNSRGIQLEYSSNNSVYLNSFYNNIDIYVLPHRLDNIWNSTSKINYTYNDITYTNYLGNYWRKYSGNDTNSDGIGDTPYIIYTDKDNYPLIEPIEKYIQIKKPAPSQLGFEAVFTILGLLAVAYLLKRRK